MFKKIEESTNTQTKYLNIFEAMVNFFKFHENSKPTDPKASMNPKHKKQKSLKSTSRHIITKLFKKVQATRKNIKHEGADRNDSRLLIRDNVSQKTLEQIYIQQIDLKKAK